jgi:hypothetical protein
MDAEIKKLIIQLFEERLKTIEAIQDLRITTFDRGLTELDGRPTVSERLVRFTWHDEAHTEELKRIKHTLGKPGPMDDDHYFATWFLQKALISRMQLIAEIFDLSDDDLIKRDKPGDRSIKELLMHVLATESGFLVEGIKKALENRSDSDRVGRRTRADFEQSTRVDEDDAN